MMNINRHYSALRLLLMVVATNVYSQDNIQKYIGFIRVDDAGAYTYQLNIEKTTSSKFVGSTTTDAGNSQETEVAITGEYSPNHKQISFAENRVIKTSVRDKDVVLCFVKATLKVKKRLNLEILEGTFVGVDENGKQCGSGSIVLTRKNQVMNNDDDFGALVKKAIDTLKTLEKQRVIYLSVDEVNEIKDMPKKISVMFYDGAKEDGDLVDIFYNGLPIAIKKELTNKGAHYKFSIEKDKPNILIVKALNLGKASPNTVNIDIKKANGKVQTYIIEADKGKEVQIRFYNN